MFYQTGSPRCPICSKSVYAAEQIIGPGRKLYHKPCLSCMICKKRLDSYTLLEHNEEPYCKSCHSKNFGTRDLRHANLPLAPPPDEGGAPRASSPTSSSPTKAAFSAQALLRPITTGGGASLPRIRPRSLISPISPTFTGVGRNQSPVRQSFSQLTGRSLSSSDTANLPSANGDTISEENEGQLELEVASSVSDASQPDTEPQQGSLPEPASDNQSAASFIPSHTGRPGLGTLPRTIPLFLNSSGSRTPFRQHGTSQSLGSIPVSSSPTSTDTSTLLTSSSTDATPSENVASPTIPDSEPSPKDEGQDTQPQPHTPSLTSLSQPRPTNDTVDLQGRSPLTALPGHRTSTSLGSVNVTPTSTGGSFSPLVTNGTGTRYGAFLSGAQKNGLGVQMAGTPGGTPKRQWGGGTPTCGRCGKSVYFAEQIKAVGKTFHRGCLRCAQCSTSLDSNKLRDHDGDPYCVSCYKKHHGPQGGGYALLGKAGG